MEQIKKLIIEFIKGYKEKDLEKIDSFMNLFSDKEDTQLIGIGATIPGAYEWFTGKSEIKEIVISDWKNWGNVDFDLNTLRITKNSDTAWLSICATLEQIDSSEDTWEFFMNQMKSFLEEPNKKSSDKMFNATHYGLRRLYERNLGKGHKWIMVITGVMIKEDKWKIHTLHWSMPVE
jgi:CYTH domain-containing protein